MLLFRPLVLRRRITSAHIRISLAHSLIGFICYAMTLSRRRFIGFNELIFSPVEQLMRRSMKRLKTFKQIRRGDSVPADPDAIQLEEMNGKSHR